MDVFLVPVAPDRYELYCEEQEELPAPAVGTAPPEGFFKRIVHRVREQLAEAERLRRRGGPAPEEAPRTLLGRLHARTLRWVAEWIAEQRLLWQLRGKSAASLIYPDDVSEAHARQLLRRSLQRDWERHRFWMIIDSFGLVGSAALILLPGPNFLGYYFLLRTGGHYLSLRGARQGLVKVTWSVEGSPALATLRTMVNDPPDAREARVQAVAHTLRLEHFASFFQRSATP
jgi:hypothetical protein